jgi:lipopolysaccharide transport system permease protein
MTCFLMLFRYRHLIWRLTLLDFKVRYAGSRMGLLWMVLAPLLVLGAYLLVFGKILRVQPGPAVTGLDYGLLVACGLLPWMGFSEGVTRGTGSVLTQRNLMKSQVFPMEIVPVTAVCVGLVGQLCGTALLLVILGIRGMLGINLLMLPFLLVVQILLSIGVVWFLSCVNVLYRDTSHVMALLMVLLMFVSPIAYTPDLVPQGFTWVLKLNPLSYLIEGYRHALLVTDRPSLGGLAAFGVFATLVFWAGHRYFMHLRRVLPDFV